MFYGLFNPFVFTFFKCNNSARFIFEFIASRVRLFVFPLPETMQFPLFADYGMLLLSL